MNFKKVNDSKLELDKSQSEIKLENKINDLFELTDLQSEMVIEYYNQILTPYIISLNLNPSEYHGYNLTFYYNKDSAFDLFKYKTDFDEEEFKIKFNSEIWNKTHQFFKDKKYKKVMENISSEDYFFINVNSISYRPFFNAENQNVWKNDLIDNQLQYFVYCIFKYFININNQKYLNLNAILKDKIIEVYHNERFCFNFDYQRATNKKEIIDMLFNLKREIEYQINVKKKKYNK